MSSRSSDDIKMIVPKEFQGDFDEPPPPVTSPNVSSSLIKGSSAQKRKKESSGLADLPSSEILRSSAPETISNALSDNRLTKVEITIKSIENDMKTLSVDMQTILKSQKVIESILTKINKELLKLREK